MVFDNLRSALNITEEQYIEKKQLDHAHRMQQATIDDALNNQSKYCDFTPQ